VRNKSWWSQPTNWETVCKRVRGRARYNAMRRLNARLRQREVLQLLARWGWKPGVQALIAAHLGVHRSTICRDLQAVLPLRRECPTCHQLWPRDGWWEADKSSPG
jgi:hypothetical protein